MRADHPSRLSAVWCLKGIGALVGLSLVFWLALAAAYAIPSSALEKEGKASVAILSQEGITPFSALEGILVDNFTVAWMTNMAVHSEGSPFEASLRNAWSGQEDQNHVQRLESWAADTSQPADRSYSRYWNGYLVYLKPLLVFFDLRQIRLIFQTAFFVLLFGAAASLVQRFGRAGMVAGGSLVFSYVVLGAADAAAVLPMFPSFAISALGAIWMARAALDWRPLARGFLLLGAFTVFFDMLDNPVLTLGIPAAVMVLRASEERSARWIVKALALAGLCWVFAYAFIWAMKWVLATVVMGENIIAEGIQRVAYRSASADKLDFAWLPLPLQAIRDNLKQGASLPLLAMALAACCALLAFSLVNADRRSRLKRALPVALCFALVGLLPFVWYVAIANHSVMHSWFTYRDQIITLFSLLLCAQFLAQRVFRVGCAR